MLVFHGEIPVYDWGHVQRSSQEPHTNSHWRAARGPKGEHGGGWGRSIGEGGCRGSKFIRSKPGWLGGGFKDVLCSSLHGETIQFDKYFSNGLKPTTSWEFHPLQSDAWCLVLGIFLQKNCPKQFRFQELFRYIIYFKAQSQCCSRKIIRNFVAFGLDLGNPPILQLSKSETWKPTWQFCWWPFWDG